ncbi:signal recognition particle-docking protein FtsY [Roseobacter sp. N2S]|uniref:signal recognition particle-docking protein FtsY n=1 Tax=Roseobacter sp. N2S TaxID=2663844 RepID=UPI00285CF141|nr:signal recognition particle-docking protein FtsY [Roseobacter sp. N2S]MDR6264223.1 fused signal recognition particle receptor [Roseobacter sp. N2S]
MSFFKKLKDRMFNSSSKIEEGLDAIVEDGGVIEAEAAQENSAAVEAARVADEQAAKQAAEQAAAREALITAKAEAAELEAAKQRAALEQAQAREAAQLAEAAAKAADQEAAQLAEAAAKAARERQAVLEAEAALAEENALKQQAAEAARLAQDLRTKEEHTETKSEHKETKQERVTTEAEKPSLLGRLFGGRSAEKPTEGNADRSVDKSVVRRALDDAMLESIEDLLITSDMGVDTAMRVSANLAEGRMGKRLSTIELKTLLAAEVTRIMEPVARPMPIYAKRPQVVLVVGVNGSGKTTTIGKLASQFKAAGKSVVIAAGDTFRAAAVEQLQVWGERAGVPVLTAPEGSDPASLAFEAMTKAEADGADLLMIDTAGRLQNRQDLMEELAKIVRVIRKKDPDAPHNTLLVLDATTGQNALSQVEIFQKIADVSGLVMTKLDGTARGGVLVALADKFGLPIHAIGLGEQIDDLAPFDPEEFARALTGLE